MNTTNQAIADSLIAHRLWLLRYEAGAVRDMVARWDAVVEPLLTEAKRLQKQADRAARGKDRPLTRAERERLEAIRAGLEEAVRAAYPEMREIMEARLLEVAETELRVIPATIEAALPPSALGAGLEVAEVPLPDFLVSVSEPIGGKVWHDRLAVDLVEAHDRLSASVTQALVRGSSMRNAAAAIKAATGIEGHYRGRLVGIARTEIQRVANTAAAETYRLNRDVVGSVQILGTLDTRTCLVCAPLHTRIVEMDAEGRVPEVIPGTGKSIPPWHTRCRCFCSPVTRSWRDLGLDLDDPAARRRMDGKEAIDLAYDQWLRRQPKEAVVEMLGPARAALFRGKRLRLDQFSDQGRILSLGELRARYPGRVPEAA